MQSRDHGTEVGWSIITHDNLLHTSWEVQVYKNTFWIEDGSEHLLEEDIFPDIWELQRFSKDSWYRQEYCNEEIYDNNLEAMEHSNNEGIKVNYDSIDKAKCCSSFGNLYM